MTLVTAVWHFRERKAALREMLMARAPRVSPSERRQGYVTSSHHPIPLSRDPQEPTFPSDSPNQDTLGASDKAHQHQEADDDIKQQQAQVPQPPVDTHRHKPGMVIGK